METKYSLHTGIRSRLGHDCAYQGVPKSDQLEGSFSSLPLLNRPEGVSYTTILNSPTGKLSTARSWRSRDRTPWPHYIFDLYVDFAWGICMALCTSLLALACTLAGWLAFRRVCAPYVAQIFADGAWPCEYFVRWLNFFVRWFVSLGRV